MAVKLLEYITFYLVWQLLILLQSGGFKLTRVEGVAPKY